MNDSWIGQSGIPLGDYGVIWVGSHIDGKLFRTAYFSPPSGMAPGDSVTIPIVLAPQTDPWPTTASSASQNGTWTDQHWAYDNGPVGVPGPDSDDWRILYRGSNATFTARETCFSQVTTQFPNFDAVVYPNLNGIFKNKLDVTFPK